jgi:hypothetical protein
VQLGPYDADWTRKREDANVSGSPGVCVGRVKAPVVMREIIDDVIGRLPDSWARVQERHEDAEFGEGPESQGGVRER